MPPRISTPRKRTLKTVAKRTKSSARTKRDASLRDELEGLYAIDGQVGDMTISAPAKGRWLRRAALVAPLAVLIQAIVVHGFPWIQTVLNRPEFVVFRIGE